MAELIRVGILTISDRCSRGLQTDLSGPAIQNTLPPDEYTIALQAVVPDEKKLISDTLRRWSDMFHIDIILTTGGTGFGPRDVTPEATEKILHRSAPNLNYVILHNGLSHTPLAALSRGTAGIRQNTLIINLPGNPDAAGQGVACLLPLFPHAVCVLKSNTDPHKTGILDQTSAMDIEC